MREFFTFIQLQELPFNSISAFWKVTHTLIYVLLTIFGFSVYYALTIAMESFEGNCAIGAKLMVYMESQTIDFLTTRWEYPTTCDVCIYIPATSCASAIVWFAILYASGIFGGIHKSSNLLKPWRVIIPNILYSAIMFIASSYAIGILEGGIAQLCATFEERAGSDRCSAMWSYLPLEEKHAVENGYLYNPYACFVAARVGSWALIWLWLGSVVLSLTRICYAADYKLVKIMLFRTPENITHLGQEPSEESIIATIVPEFSFVSIDGKPHWLLTVNWKTAVGEEILENAIKAFRFNNISGITPRVMQLDIFSSEPQKTKDAEVQTSPSLYYTKRVKLQRLVGNFN